MRPRELEALALLQSHGPMQRAEVARRLGCAPATAGQHLWLCKVAGKAHSVGWGCRAVWHPGPAPAVQKAAQKVAALHDLQAVWR
jgi:hypothetical protein